MWGEVTLKTSCRLPSSRSHMKKMNDKQFASIKKLVSIGLTSVAAQVWLFTTNHYQIEMYERYNIQFTNTTKDEAIREQKYINVYKKINNNVFYTAAFDNTDPNQLETLKCLPQLKRWVIKLQVTKRFRKHTRATRDG